MDRVYLTLFYVFKFLIKIMPKCAEDGFIKALAWLYMRLDKRHFNVVMTNLNLAFGNTKTDDEKLEIARRVYINFARFLGVNFIKNQNTTKQDVLKRVEFKNEEFLEQAMASNRGVIVATAHLGEWELFSLAMAAKYGAVSIIGRKLDSKSMDRVLSKNREQFDIEVIEKSGAARGILKALKSRRIVGILVDQNTAKSEGVEVEFFSRRALHTPAASIMALKSGALIVPAYIRLLENGKNEICFDEPIDVNELSDKLGKDAAVLSATQAQASSCECAIKRAVDQYFWFHKRFKHFYESEYR